MVDPEEARAEREELRQRRAERPVDAATRRRWASLVRGDQRSLAWVAELDNVSILTVREAVRSELQLAGRAAADIDELLRSRTEEVAR